MSLPNFWGEHIRPEPLCVATFDSKMYHSWDITDPTRATVGRDRRVPRIVEKLDGCSPLGSDILLPGI